MKTRLSMHDNDDGTTSGHFVVPAFAEPILRKAVEQITAPRRVAARIAREVGRSWTVPEDYTGIFLRRPTPSDHPRL